jgi:hypothetical protein
MASRSRRGRVYFSSALGLRGFSPRPMPSRRPPLSISALSSAAASSGSAAFGASLSSFSDSPGASSEGSASSLCARPNRASPRRSASCQASLPPVPDAASYEPAGRAGLRLHAGPAVASALRSRRAMARGSVIVEGRVISRATKDCDVLDALLQPAIVAAARGFGSAAGVLWICDRLTKLIRAFCSRARARTYKP